MFFVGKVAEARVTCSGAELEGAGSITYGQTVPVSRTLVLRDYVDAILQ